MAAVLEIPVPGLQGLLSTVKCRGKENSLLEFAWTVKKVIITTTVRGFLVSV